VQFAKTSYNNFAPWKYCSNKLQSFCLPENISWLRHWLKVRDFVFLYMWIIYKPISILITCYLNTISRLRMRRDTWNQFPAKKRFKMLILKYQNYSSFLSSKNLGFRKAIVLQKRNSFYNLHAAGLCFFSKMCFIRSVILPRFCKGLVAWFASWKWST